MTKAVIFDTETTGRKAPIIIEGAWLALKSVDPFKLGLRNHLTLKKYL